MQTDQPTFVKVENVPEEEEIKGETFTRHVEWFKSQVRLVLNVFHHAS